MPTWLLMTTWIVPPVQVATQLGGLRVSGPTPDRRTPRHRA